MRDIIVTIAAVILAVAAFDDITTDHDTNFVFERAALIMCAGWFLVTAWRVSQAGRRALGRTSVAAALAVGLAQWAIGPGTAQSRIAYIVMLTGLGWFVVVTGILAWSRLFQPQKS
jgi:undecaprenyl pyrophosphate phosphatase UppP